MATTTETVLLQVDTKVNLERLQELQKLLGEIVGTVATLNKQFAAGKIGLDEYTAGQSKLIQQTKQITAEQNTLTKAVAAQVVADKEAKAQKVAAAGSIDELQGQLKEAAKAYNALSKEERLAGDEGIRLSLEQQKLTALVAEATRERKEQIAADKEAAKQLATLDKIQQSAAGSINQLRAQLSKGTAAYNALSEAERDNTEAGQALQAANKALSDRLKELEGRIGDTRRNVGNYAGSLKDAIKESGFLGGITDKVTQAQETFSKAQVIAKAAIGGNVTALGFLRLALIATGLGALVVVLGSVVAFLTKSQTGIDLVSRKFAGLKAIVSLVTGAAAEFGETLFKAAENPKQALLDLVEFIEGNLVNRFKALGIIFKALLSGNINQLSEGLFQLSTGVTDVTGKLGKFAAQALEAAKAGEAIEAESQRILRAERALNVERSESRAKIEALKKLSDDSTKSVAVRLQAAKTAAAIENRLLAQQLRLQDDKIKNTIKESLLDKQQTNDELDAIAELRAARADTQQESLTLQTELQNKLNSLNEEARKALDGAALEDFNRMVEQTKREEEQGKQRFDDSLKTAAARTAAEDKARADKLAKDKAAYDADLANLTRNLEARRLANETALADGTRTQKQYDEVLRLIDEGGYSARLLLAKQYNQDVNAADADRTRFHNSETEKRTAKQRTELEKQLSVANSFTEQVGSLLAQTLTDTGQTIEQFAGKVLIIILDVLEKQVLAQAAAATAQSLASADSVATYGAAGVAKAAIINGLIIAAFEGAKAIITASTTSQFADGGIIPGPSHAAGGVPFTVAGRGGFEAEGGEAIMTKGAVQRFAPVLSWLNVQGGGKPFHYAAGGVLPAPQQIDGGLMARQIGAAAAMDYDALAVALSKQPIFVVPAEIRQAEARRAIPRQRASIGRP